MVDKKEEKKTEAIVPAKRQFDAEIVLYTGNAEVSKELEKAQTLHQTDFYQVAGKTVPSARALQWLANRKNIKTKIIDIQSTREYCRVVIAGWIGSNPNPTANRIYKEATVEMMFDVEIIDKIIELISKNNLVKDKDYGIDKETGTPFLLNPRFIEKQMKELLRLRKFALRTVVTKAERIIHSKLADVEWREEDEMLDEQSEIGLVSGKNITPLETKPEPKPTPTKPEIKDAEQVEPVDDIETEEVGKNGASQKPVPKKLNIPDDLLGGIKKPREAYAIVHQWALENQVLDNFGDIVMDTCPDFQRGVWDIINIPENDIIQILEVCTGLKYKKSEKSLKCKGKDCDAKITEPEAEEQDGLCLKCFKNKQESE